MTGEHNWAGNYTFEAGRILRPTSIDEVRRMVTASSQIHAIGSRHSFNGAADSPGDIIDLGGITSQFVIDPDRRTVTARAGTNYGVLTATGELMEITRGQPGFDGMVVGLGAFGVVTRVTLDIEPRFDMRQDAYDGLPWTTLIADFGAVTSAAYSVGILTMWSGETVSRLWLKTRLIDGNQPAVSLAHLGASLSATPTATNVEQAVLRLNPFGVPGPWSERLTHFRPEAYPGPTDQVQSEYMLPRAQAAAAFAQLRAIGERIDRHLLVTEIRTMAGDPLWLRA